VTETTLRSQTREVSIGPDRPFAVIGERINPTGREKLRAELLDRDFSRVSRDARDQVAAGALILDINVGVGSGDEAQLMAEAVEAVQSEVSAPLCIDSASADAIEAGLSACRGKALVNSVTGERARLDQLLPIVAHHGAAVIGIANDETGISNDPEVRYRVAKKIVDRAAAFGIPPEDVLIDPLIMPAGVVPGAGRVAVEIVRRIENELGCNTVGGVSNVSMGLPGRPQLNATMLALLLGAGTRCVIANPLDDLLRWTVLAADVLTGADEDCRVWLRRHRDAARHPTTVPRP
jgi:5-methyltetrahydrofolate--homocysteine methyltransferase